MFYFLSGLILTYIFGFIYNFFAWLFFSDWWFWYDFSRGLFPDFLKFWTGIGIIVGILFFLTNIEEK